MRQDLKSCRVFYIATNRKEAKKRTPVTHKGSAFLLRCFCPNNADYCGWLDHRLYEKGNWLTIKNALPCFHRKAYKLLKVMQLAGCFSPYSFASLPFSRFAEYQVYLHIYLYHTRIKKSIPI